MNSLSLRCTSPAAHVNPVAPTSVSPVWSMHRAPHAASIRARVDAMLAPGSPAWIVTRTPIWAGSIPALRSPI